jgi:hypothetical protein
LLSYLKFSHLFSFLFLLLLGWVGVHCTFTDMYQIYHTWIHPLPCSLSFCFLYRNSDQQKLSWVTLSILWINYILASLENLCVEAICFSHLNFNIWTAIWWISFSSLGGKVSTGVWTHDLVFAKQAFYHLFSLMW